MTRIVKKAMGKSDAKVMKERKGNFFAESFISSVSFGVFFFAFNVLFAAATRQDFLSVRVTLHAPRVLQEPKRRVNGWCPWKSLAALGR
jgi:hypothetical protein